jgi:hypothetical protein
MSRDVAYDSNPPSTQPLQSTQPTEHGEPQINVYQDPDFVRNLLSSLPGVDIGSDSLQEAIEKRRKEEDDKTEEDK